MPNSRQTEYNDANVESWLPSLPGLKVDATEIGGACDILILEQVLIFEPGFFDIDSFRIY